MTALPLIGAASFGAVVGTLIVLRLLLVMRGRIRDRLLLAAWAAAFAAAAVSTSFALAGPMAMIWALAGIAAGLLITSVVCRAIASGAR